MYDFNSAHSNLLYTDHMIYSPLVPVFRDDEDQLTDQHYLILGAWGCGVFRNSTEDVAAWFAHHLLKNETFKNAFTRIVFAIYDPSGKKKTAEAFKQQFSNLTYAG